MGMRTSPSPVAPMQPHANPVFSADSEQRHLCMMLYSRQWGSACWICCPKSQPSVMCACIHTGPSSELGQQSGRGSSEPQAENQSTGASKPSLLSPGALLFPVMRLNPASPQSTETLCYLSHISEGTNQHLQLVLQKPGFLYLSDVSLN